MVRRAAVVAGSLTLAAAALVSASLSSAEAGSTRTPPLPGAGTAEAAAVSGAAGDAAVTEWSNSPDVFEAGTEPAHATFMPYGALDQALASDRTDSPWRLDLDGTWKFAWSPNPAERIADFWAAEDAAWDDIAVP